MALSVCDSNQHALASHSASLWHHVCLCVELVCATSSPKQQQLKPFELDFTCVCDQCGSILPLHKTPELYHKSTHVLLLHLYTAPKIQRLFFHLSRYMAVKCWCGRTRRDCAYKESKSVKKTKTKKKRFRSGKLNMRFTKIKNLKKWHVQIRAMQYCTM